MPERGSLTLSERAWIEAKRRATVIVPLAAADRIPSVVARAASEELGLSERSIYALVRRYRRSGGLLTSLAPQSSPGGRGKARLSRAAERIIADTIRDEYLTRQKKRAEAVVRAVRERAIAAGITPPAANTVRARVRAVKAELAARRRDGGRSAAARRLAPAAGMTPLAERPMAVLQVDHTPVDLILVDEAYRKPVGRPWLTVAIDVMSRCIAGFLVSFESAMMPDEGIRDRADDTRGVWAKFFVKVITNVDHVRIAVCHRHVRHAVVGDNPNKSEQCSKPSVHRLHEFNGFMSVRRVLVLHIVRQRKVD
ncbi:helix-turn-helix domain-containing protein [Sinorhizobium meliloti]|nr:helix-turn-helix domain-containing protein [Sinorhizobium meliloti]